MIRNLREADLRMLRLFRSIVEHRSLTFAADHLNISLSSVSTQLSALETRLGLVLCLRGRGGFSVTEHGQALYQTILQLDRYMDEIAERIDGINEKLTGELRLAIGAGLTDLPEFALQDALRRFKDRSDTTRISMIVRPVAEIQSLIMNETAEVGLTIADRANGSCNQDELTTETISLYCGRGHPLFDRSEAELRGTDILAYERCYREYVRFDGTRRRKRTPLHTATANDLESMLVLIGSGRFLGYLPRQYAENAPVSTDLRELLPSEFSFRNRIMLVTKKNHPLSQVAVAFIEDIHAH